MSSDFANVQNVVPGISLRSFIGTGFGGHTKEMAEATISEEGHDALIAASKVMAMMAIDIYTNTDLLAQIKKEFDEIEKFPYPQPKGDVETFP